MHLNQKEQHIPLQNCLLHCRRSKEFTSFSWINLLNSLQGQQCILTQKERQIPFEILFCTMSFKFSPQIPFEIVFCTMCNRPRPSLPTHPVYVSQLPDIIIRVRPSWTWRWRWWKLLHPPHILRSNFGSKMAKLGANLNCSVWVGEYDNNLDNFTVQYLMVRELHTQRASILQ